MERRDVREMPDRVRRAFRSARDLDPSPEFLAQLRTKLHDTADRESARRGVRLRGWLAVAATVLVAVSLGLTYRARDWIAGTGTLERAAVGDHRNCALQARLAQKPISLGEAAQLYGPVYRVLEKLPPNEVMTADGLAHVLERHSCLYEGRRFAHVVFEYRGARVSLLVTTIDRSTSFAVPGEARPHVTPASRIEDMPVVSFRTAHHVIFLAGDVADIDLVKLADAVAGPLYRELAGG